MANATATAATEMKGPVKAVLWIHNAILEETSAFQEAVERLATDDSADASGLLPQFKFFRKVLEVHEESEDRDVFPLLEERYVHVTDTYGYDHRRQQALYQEIERAIQRVSDRGLERRDQEIVHLRRRAEEFGTLMELHVAKENELLYPLYDQTFSVEEQVAINGKIQQEHPPESELMGQMVPWMFRRQTPEDRIAVAQFFMGVFPPEGRPGLVKMLSGGVTPDEWAAVTRAVPELA
jgi:hemerythrin-like domain-containing protein